MKALVPCIVFLLTLAVCADDRPREIVKPPVNGTDQMHDPVAVMVRNNFTTREACKFVEHGDSLALVESIAAMESPHTDWASPSAGKPVRVLALCWLNHAAARTAIELRQRSDFQVDIVLIPASLRDSAAAGSTLRPMFQERLRLALDGDHDVILLSSEAFMKFDEDIADRLLAKIEAGTGVVCYNDVQQWWRSPKPLLEKWQALVPIDFTYGSVAGQPNRSTADHWITRGISLHAWPPTNSHAAKADEGAEVLAATDGRPLLATTFHGLGRVVGLYYHNAVNGGIIPRWDREALPRHDNPHEPVYALWLKALAWAAGHEPDQQLRVPDTIQAVAGSNVDVALLDAQGNLRWRLIDSLGTPVSSGEETLAQSLQLQAPSGNGDYRLEVWLLDDGNVVDWGAVPVIVTGGASLTLDVAPTTAPMGGSATYRLTSTHPGQLIVTAFDDLDRLFFQQRLPIDQSAEITIDLSSSCLPRNRIVFALHDGETPMVRVASTLYVPRIGVASMGETFCMPAYGWVRAEAHLEPMVGDLFRLLGLNAIYANWHNRDYVRQHTHQGLYSITGAMSPYLKQTTLEKELVSCPNKPEIRAEWRKNIAQAKLDIERYGGIGRVVNDEAFFAFTKYEDGAMKGAQACQCEHCLASFKSYLRESYPTISDVNDAWSTTFASFDELRVVEEEDLATNDNPSGWLEFRQFANQVYARDFYGWMQEEHAALGPSYGVGAGAPNWTSREGGPTYRGGDFGTLRPHMRFIMAYGGQESMVFPGAYVGQPGAQKYDPPLHWQQWGPWAQLFAGADALWFYYGSQIIGPELAWRRHAEWIETGIEDIRDGVGTLVSGANRLDRQVRILYSPENMALAWLFLKRTDAWRGLRLKEGRPISEQTMRDLFSKLLFIQPGNVVAEEIRQGDLHDCKLLILPQALAMDEATADAIRLFVANGGTVVADLLPATRTRFGKPRPESLLADLFGVDATQAQLHHESEAWTSIGLLTSDPRFSEETTWLQGDVWQTGIAAAGATSVGKAYSREGREADTFFIHETGKGRTLLLNFLYRDLNLDSSGWHQIFGNALVRLATLQPPARILDPYTGAPLPYRPIHAFERGAATLIGAMRGHSVWSGGKPILIDESSTFDAVTTVRFTWPEPRHAYNVRTRDYYGKTTSAELDLPSFHGRLLALLPYRPTAVQATLPSAATAGQRLEIPVQLMVDAGLPGEHVLYMQVHAPSGARRPLYCQTRIAPEGRTTFTLPFAFNDPPGEWRVAIRDVMTGIEQVATITLTEDAP